MDSIERSLGRIEMGLEDLGKRVTRLEDKVDDLSTGKRGSGAMWGAGSAAGVLGIAKAASLLFSRNGG